MAPPIWTTPAGSIGTYPSTVPIAYQLAATPVSPAVSLTYALLSGSLPSGLTISSSGLLHGTPALVTSLTSYTFVVRATDNLNNIRDRTFVISLSGSAVPTFTAPSGVIATILDSTWTQFPVEYTNPVSTNNVVMRVIEGNLPPGLEINAAGLIRGYAQAPVIQVNTETIATIATYTNGVNNVITSVSTTGFIVGRPIIFSGTTFGSINANQTYYIRTIVNATQFTISGSIGGATIPLTTDSGSMNVTLPAVTFGQPVNETYSFTLQISSRLGSSKQVYAIKVVNQNTPISQGGPGQAPNTRIPTIFNTRPETYILNANEREFGYYVLPPQPTVPGQTYTPTQFAYMGTFVSGDFFAFSILGHDFDSDVLRYNFSNLPLGLVGDPDTGWITGNPTIGFDHINQYNFSVSVTKIVNNTTTNINSATFNFAFNLTNNVSADIIWLSPANLGKINNGAISTLQVLAKSDVALQYRKISGTLPPNLTLMTDGEIAGIVAYQPTSELLPQGASTDFSFTVQAYSPQFPIIQSTLDFTLTIYQEFDHPTDTLYINCTPSITDRQLIASLLDSNSLIPPSFLYRPQDPNFGKATEVVYEHAYRIDASDLDQYLAAITKNHYWRQITLGQIDIAQAIDETTGKVLYEVVYSQIIDNLINYNEVDRYQIESQTNIMTPQGESVAKRIYWPRPVPLPTGGYARTFYPNSLPNMRQQVADVLGQQTNYQLLPAWMTSQQPNGSTLGFTPAWVIAYCLPGTTTLPDGTTVSFAQYIQHQIQTNWLNTAGQLNTLNTINFQIDRFNVNKTITYDYDTTVIPHVWTQLPSATPPPDPTDADDFTVLFPQRTILPNESQY